MAERVIPRRPGARIVAVAVLTLVVAELAAILLAPGGLGPDPAEIVSDLWFPAERAQEGADYQSGQRLLGLAGLLFELATLALVATVAMPLLRRIERRLGRPLLAAALIGVLVVVLLAVVDLVPGLIAHERAVDAGISTQGVGGWLVDRARSLGFTAPFAAAGGAILIGVQRRLPRAWPALAAAVVVGFAVVQSFLAPLVIAPAFNDFEPLPAGQTRSEVLDLAQRAGVDVGEVYEVDASSRSTSFNAYVSGIGSTRRVVIYDNLIDGTGQAALRSVVAHELGHVAGNDILRGITFVAIVAPLGMLVVAMVGGRLAARAGSGPGRAAAVAPYAFAVTIVSFALGLVGNQLSQQVERRADQFALELTDDPQGLVCLQQRLGAANLSDPDPPGWSQALFATHPTKLQRIGAAVSYGAETAAPRPDPLRCRDGPAAAGRRAANR